MLKNYFTIALRNLLKNKTSSFINIGGLAAGMAAALLIGLWIWDELSFNSYFTNHKRIAQVMINQTENGEITTGHTVAMPVAEVLQEQYAGIIKKAVLTSFDHDHIIAIADKKFSRQGMWVQSAYPTMFSLTMIEGNADALKDPSSIFISAAVAKTLFGNEGALNKTIHLDNKQYMKVAGVYEDFPHNSMFYETTLLLPWENKENTAWTNAMADWDNHCGQAFVELNAGVDIGDANKKVKHIPSPHIKQWKEELMLHPLEKQHLYSEFKNGKAAGGRIDVVRPMGIIGIFVLLLACINFMNLSTARSEKRAREVGIRKAIGSLRKQLVMQFLSESVLTAFIAMLLAIALVQLSLSSFNDLAEKQISIKWTNPLLLLSIIGFTLFTGLLAGSYPAFYLSSFEPVKVLKGVFRGGRLAWAPRKVLVITQFAISISLIIGTIVVYRQVNYSQSRPVGYNRAGLVTVPLTPDLWGRFQPLKNDLLQTGAVENAAESSYSPAYISNNNSIEWRGKDPSLVTFFRDLNVTHDFGKTIGWSMKEGRDFSKEFSTDTASAIINEAGAKAMGFSTAVGEKVNYAGKEYTIVGIVKDMLTQSPYEPVPPSIFFCSGWMGVIDIRLQPGISYKEAISKIEPVFKKHSPNSLFEYKFIEDEYAKKFSNEEKVGRLAALFASLAIFISCLGLFGLASFVAEKRSKELAVRKVMGASSFTLWRLLSREFLLLVTISLFIAIPVARYFMHGWLANFYYRAEIVWWIYALAGSGAILLTMITVSFQAIKAAIANPLKSLRTE